MPLITKGGSLLLVDGAIAANEACCCGECNYGRSGIIEVMFSVLSSPAGCDFNGDYSDDGDSNPLLFDFDAFGSGLFINFAAFIDTADGGTGTGVIIAPELDCCMTTGTKYFNFFSGLNVWIKYVDGVEECRETLDNADEIDCDGTNFVAPATVTVISSNPLDITISMGDWEFEITEIP